MLYSENNILNRSISSVCFGGASLSGEGGGYGFGQMSEKEAEALIKSSFDAGINIFDTAPIYGFGLSEERLGRYLPLEAMIVSKGGVDWHANKRVNMTNSPSVLSRMLDESLKRLNRDCIDIYMIHWPDAKVDIRDAIKVLVEAKEKGKINHIGLCNTTSQDLEKAEEITSIKVLQSEVNVFSNQLEGLEIGHKLLQSWGTLDKGILSGRVTDKRVFSKEDCRSWAPWWNRKEVANKIKRVNRLKEILDDYGYSLFQFCVSFNLSYSKVDNCLIGLKTVNDLVELTSNLQQIIPRETIKEILNRWSN